MLKIISSEGEERFVHPVDVKPFLEIGWQLANAQNQSMIGIAKRVAAQTETIAPTGNVLTPARELEPFPIQSIKSAPAEQPTVILPLEKTPEKEGISVAFLPDEEVPVGEPVTVIANDRVKELEAMHWRELETLARELNLTKPEGTNWVQMIPLIIAKETENAANQDNQESGSSSPTQG